MALHASSLLLSICLIATVLALPSPAIHSLTVNVSPFAELAASGPLRHSLNHLYDFIFNFEKDVSVSGECSEAFPPALFIDLIVTWKEHHLTPAAEGYTVATNTSSGDVSILANGLLGVAYAIHDFTQHLGLQLSRSPAASCVAYTAHWREVSAAFHAVPVSPVALRTWTEEGQLLALPDPGYYTASGLAANITALLSEAQALEGEIVPNILRLHFNRCAWGLPSSIIAPPHPSVTSPVEHFYFV